MNGPETPQRKKKKGSLLLLILGFAQKRGRWHTGFSLWVGEPFKDTDAKRFVARYIERAPLSLEKLSLEHDILTYTTKDGTATDYDPLEFLAMLTAHNLSAIARQHI